MAFCTKCGTSLNEGNVFCPSCGTKNAVEGSTFRATVNTHGKLHCPQCKSYNISITTESSVTGAITANHGRMSTTSVSNTHRNFWMCGDCGAKFRNIQNLEEEIAKTKSSPIIAAVIFIISFILSVYLIIKIKSSTFGFLLSGFAITSTIFAIVSFCFIFVYTNRLKKMREELAYLKDKCFN